jgi:hypothetical protein
VAGLPSAILVWGDLKEKAPHSLRSLTGFFVCFKLKASLSFHQTKKPAPLSRMGFFFCRGGRIRTCDPLVPNQMR